MERYPTTKDKLGLLIESSCIAKVFLVQEKGIGEDMPPTIVGWTKDKVTVLAQADMERQLQEVSKQIERLAELVVGGWGTGEVTLITEGYCNVGAEQEERPLREAFIDNPDIKECLSFIHVSHTGKPVVVAVPYTCGLGRTTTMGMVTRVYADDFSHYWKPIASAILSKQPLTSLDIDEVEEIKSLGWSVVDEYWDA